MKSDRDIKTNVETELRWDPDLDATDIAVAVKDGVVTLTGYVHRYSHRRQAEEDAKRIVGVLAVANDIEVHLPIIGKVPDPEIAREVVSALQRELPLASDQIKVTVRDGWVTLEGDVEWNYQRNKAEGAAYWTKGVKGVDNAIRVNPRVAPSEIKQKIEQALVRSAALDANRITVEANGRDVILKGKVRSWFERDEAERAAWAAPGVARVDDQIAVTP